ncbi:hypothetical protein GQR58_028931 [Nymphon striatum]|nr:hypothetical protein GQR58_028931 [Nymphon striatum]
MKKNQTLLLIIVVLFTTILSAQDNWEVLFNGKDLKNFKQLNGDAKYEIKNNELIGTSKMGIPNSFMATKNTYGDFILEFDVFVENGLNSGVQFRSLSTSEYMDGRGTWLSIARKWAGGIYDEARNGWLYPLSRNLKGQKAFVPGQWNHYRIEAIGNNIRTWINNVQCANLVDNTTAEGKWKNIKIKTSDLEQSRKSVDSDVPEISYLKNILTENEARTGWRLLWDGKTTNGWRGAKLTEFPENGWEISDGILSVLSSGGAESRNGGDIVTNDLYSNFELSVDFKMTEGANSGIKYFVDSELNKGEGSAIGLEFQILDDKKHPDAKAGKNGNRTVGAENNGSSRGKNFKGVGKWNNARVVVRDGHVEHWLNQVKVVEFDRSSQFLEP